MRTRNLLRTRWLGLAMAVALGLLLASAAVAAPVEVPPGSDPLADGDGGEVGVEYVNWYPGSGDLYLTDDDALGLYNSLGSAGWSKRFAYGNSWAWEEDFKRRDRGGTEHNYVDTVDLAYFSGHGGTAWDSAFGRNLSALVFGEGAQDHDDPYLVPGDAYQAWGDDDMEWIGFSACQVLSDASQAYWASAMNRLHLILGYKTIMLDVVHGERFARYLRQGYTLTQAWFKATDDLQTSIWQSICARVLAEERDQYDDTLSSQRPDYSPNGWFWYWDHCTRRWFWASASNHQEVDRMPLFQVVPPYMTTDQASALAAAFGIGNAPAILDDEGFYLVREGPLDLMVDGQGLYSFINLDRLWVASDAAVAAAARVSADDARQIAEQFLRSHGLLPPDAAFQGVTLERMTEVGMVESPTALGTGQVLPQITEIVSGTVDTGWQVSYSRVISFTPAGGDPVAFPVDGPGAKLDVYVSMDGQVIGARGGWRELEEVATLDTVEVLAPDRMNQLFTALEPIVNLLHTPFAAHDVVIAGSTLGYFEREAGATQTTLLPVYMLDLSFRDEGGQELTRSVGYVPVAPELMSPLANITSLSEEGTLAMIGDVLMLTAADASQPLSALGYGDDLDFALGRPPYTYIWYLNDTPLGQGQPLNYTVAAGDVPTGQKGGAPLRITLVVEDGNGNRSVSTRSVQVLGLTLGTRRYLPMIQAR